MKKLKRMLCCLLSVIMFACSFTIVSVSAAVNNDTVVTLPVKVTKRYDLANEFFEYLNEKRVESGKEPYQMDQTVLEVAMERAAQLVVHFTHKSINRGDAPRATVGLAVAS